jgi:hypothetical protein
VGHAALKCTNQGAHGLFRPLCATVYRFFAKRCLKRKRYRGLVTLCYGVEAEVCVSIASGGGPTTNLGNRENCCEMPMDFDTRDTTLSLLSPNFSHWQLIFVMKNCVLLALSLLTRPRRGENRDPPPSKRHGPQKLENTTSFPQTNHGINGLDPPYCTQHLVRAQTCGNGDSIEPAKYHAISRPTRA